VAPREHFDETLAAMRHGDEVIYQDYLENSDFAGYRTSSSVYQHHLSLADGRKSHGHQAGSPPEPNF
jgi:hypothetical protein